MEDEYERQKIFILVKIKLIWLIAKNVKSNFKALKANNEIGRVKIIEFFRRKTSRKREKIKLQRAYGGCLGTWRRRRT